MMIRRCLFFVFVFVFVQINAQHTNLPLSHDANLIFEKEFQNTDIHTSFKPLIKSTINNKINTDSLLLSEFPNNWINWYKRKLFSEHLVIIKGEDYKVTASPIIHFSKGKESENETNTFTNTRGFVIEGDIGESVSFYSTFSENQAIFPNYLDAKIRQTKDRKSVV